MKTLSIALISTSEAVPADLASAIAAAVQLQISRDFAPIWGVSATVSYFPSLESMPVGYWPVTISDQIADPNAGGFHLDQNNQPYASILAAGDVSLEVSHECMEMLVDPQGNRFVSGPSLINPQAPVNYLVEVCDPCEDEAYAYQVNGLPVSDFYTPSFFDPSIVAGNTYSFTGAVTQPRQILPGGYISWVDPTDNHVHQRFNNAGQIQDVDRGVNQTAMSFREWVDIHSRRTAAASKRERDVNPSVRGVRPEHLRASAYRAASLRDCFKAKVEI
jgi:hypothetical protein